MARKNRSHQLIAVPERQEAVLYARVSSRDQEETGFSIDAQKKLIRRYCDSRGFEVVEEFVDAETAKTVGRTDFLKMLTFLRKRPMCSLVVEKMDRLSRNLRDWVTLDELGVEIHFAKEGQVKSEQSGPAEQFMYGIGVLMAKMYNDNLSQETKKGMLEKAEQGYWPSRAPIGYQNIVAPDSKKTLIVPNPDTAPLVTKTFERYATSEFSLQEVTRKAKADGLVFLKSRKPLPVTTIHRMLKNPIYYGDFIWKGITYQGKHQPLVSKELWDRVQDVLEKKSSKKIRRQRKNDFAFSGLITCGECDHLLIGHIKKQKYIYYRCTRMKNSCSIPYIKEKTLETQFSEAVRRLSFDEETLAWVKEALMRSHADEQRHHEESVSRLQAEYKKLQTRIDVMYEDRLDGRVTAEQFDARASAWRSEQARLRRSMEDHETANDSYLDAGSKLLELASKAGDLFEKQPPREKRKLLNFILSNSVWREGKLEVEFRQPFDMIAEAASEHRAKKASGASVSELRAVWRPQRESNPCLRRERPMS